MTGTGFPVRRGRRHVLGRCALARAALTDAAAGPPDGGPDMLKYAVAPLHPRWKNQVQMSCAGR